MSMPSKASMYNFMNNLYKVLIEDEELIRLLYYKPMGFDSNTKTNIPDPLSHELPNLVNDSKQYWDIVKDRIRKGEKRAKIEEDIKCYIYMHEGTDRSIFGNICSIHQQVIFSVYIHEEFEQDWRMSRIKDRLTSLLVFTIGLAGYGKMEYVGGDPRDATTGYRRIDYRYMFNTKKKR